MPKLPIRRPPPDLVWTAPVDTGGLRLELNAELDELVWPLAAIVADEQDDSLWLELYVNDSAVQIPLAVIRDAIEAGAEGARSEAWLERNRPSDADPDPTPADT